MTINTGCNNQTIFVNPVITKLSQLTVNGDCSPDFKIRMFSCIFINDEIYDRACSCIHVAWWNRWRDNKPSDDQCVVHLNVLIYKQALFSLVLILCPLVHMGTVSRPSYHLLLEQMAVAYYLFSHTHNRFHGYNICCTLSHYYDRCRIWIF